MPASARADASAVVVRLEGTSSGDDILVGSDGADTFVLGLGGGHDRIANHGHAGDGDRVLFDDAITRDQLWFRRDGDSLVVDVIGTGDGVAVEDWFIDAGNMVARIETAAGDWLLGQDVANLVAAMASMTPPSAGQSQLSADQHQQLDPILAANWQSH